MTGRFGTYRRIWWGEAALSRQRHIPTLKPDFTAVMTGPPELRPGKGRVRKPCGAGRIIQTGSRKSRSSGSAKTRGRCEGDRSSAWSGRAAYRRGAQRLVAPARQQSTPCWAYVPFAQQPVHTLFGKRAVSTTRPPDGSRQAAGRSAARDSPSAEARITPARSQCLRWRVRSSERRQRFPVCRVEYDAHRRNHPPCLAWILLIVKRANASEHQTS